MPSSKVCYVCETGGYETSYVVKVTTKKSNATIWLRRTRQIIKEFLKIHEQWMKAHHEDKETTELWEKMNKFADDNNIHLDTNYAFYTEMKLE